MNYSAKDMAGSFRTVRKNTVQVAEDIPEDKYDFRAAPGLRSVAEMLAHVAASTWWAKQMHGVERKTHVGFEDWSGFMAKGQAMEKALTSKAQIVEALRKNGDEFTAWLDTVSDEVLAEHVSFPPPINPPSRSRFEMLLSVKEHEMHHRGQLMLIERLLGIVPHLTRARETQAT
ncbi:MAG: DinB family protein [Acidobacteria bacterium]|nr:DinB family protein [Acidobacteriota bacterium]